MLYVLRKKNIFREWCGRVGGEYWRGKGEMRNMRWKEEGM